MFSASLPLQLKASTSGNLLFDLCGPIRPSRFQSLDSAANRHLIDATYCPALCTWTKQPACTESGEITSSGMFRPQAAIVVHMRLHTAACGIAWGLLTQSVVE